MKQITKNKNKQTNKQKHQQHIIAPALHQRCRYYQAIALNDQELKPTSLAPLSPQLNNSTKEWKEFVNTEKLVTGLAHKRRNRN